MAGPKRPVAGSTLTESSRPDTVIAANTDQRDYDVRIVTTIADQHYSTLADTGATISVIDYRLVEQIALRKPSIMSTPAFEAPTVSAVNGSPIQVMGKCKLKITIANYEFVHTFVFCRNVYPAVILGNDFLIPQGAVIDLSDMVVTFKKSNTATPIINVCRKIPMVASINCNSLKPEQSDLAHQLIHRFQNLFNENNPGQLRLNMAHRIETGNAEPTIAYRRHFGPRELDEVNRQIDDMLRLGIVWA